MRAQVTQYKSVFLVILLFAFIGTGLAESRFSRTVYDGYVGIEPTSIFLIKKNLEKYGCSVWGKLNNNGYKCYYIETIYNNENAVDVYPYGHGFGLMNFYLTKDKLIALKDILGKPNIEIYKNEVRKDLKAIGNIVKIQENSWTNIKTKYPVDVLY